ncbi:hypothetical protein [Mangrovibacillus cuniculi]|uniref:Uncharacterized protein n=1 Tax=Mangrovibacillus cuniculi TaxID=2593652 RepID=A0A7S8CBZ0_9BACI|nr:hypothetical protein [Mangrovibacillus cuniculi]QPC47127.1 hypothetical protein G8O30_09185 [Mangrovibacillus cuniculi]
MIKSALEYIVGLGEVELFRENGQTLSDKKLYPVEAPIASRLSVHSLTGVVDYLKSNLDVVGKTIVHVKSPTHVVVFGALNMDKNREYFIEATAMLPEYRFESWYDAESFNIKLQSAFVKNADRDVMLKVVGNIKEEDVKTYGDNGVSQSVTAKVGVATVGQVEVPNPVSLAPYRTFVEVQQPSSDFVFRMQNGPRCGLFEADGGAWKLEAMENVKKYLSEALADIIEQGQVPVIA